MKVLKSAVSSIGILILLLSLTGCMRGEYTTIHGEGGDTPNSTVMKYEKFDGFVERSFQVKSGHTAEVKLDIVSDGGKLNISIKDEEGNSYYTGTGVPTSSFSVKLDHPSQYVISIQGKGHQGKYDIAWELD
ncbi:hypothetical protein [Paenibacillus aceti]|uniref:Lipoprotein n=1 Tax=Paenibacillus aceti TaxID=1820010 RepID=A0ABQ1VQH2_9BACL|nr:hypothetical protein [Paenibacillus aceti]GGF89485.1 hypothetical protein GCM10010913_08620 [Paenibacillus aceti]